MYEVVFAPAAEAQLLDLYSLIANAASPEIAEQYTEAIVQQCESLKTFPARGTRRDDIRPGLRVFGFRRRVSIAFEITGNVVTILGVYYAGRNFETILHEG
jgi:plasmid stabilization system protein ParE